MNRTPRRRAALACLLFSLPWAGLALGQEEPPAEGGEGGAEEPPPAQAPSDPSEPPSSGPEAMTPERLIETIEGYATVLRRAGNVVEFEYENIALLCVFDERADRMRIVSEILEAEQIPVEQLRQAMRANFHSALDARYAIGGEKLYTAFVHPLSPLTPLQVESAIRQVATLNATFGTTYSSGELFYRGGYEEEDPEI